jgi:YidC/Oxa1 family membrane protein insertase
VRGVSPLLRNQNRGLTPPLGKRTNMPQQQQQSKNLIVFLILAFLIYVAWVDLKNRFFPPPKPPEKTETASAIDRDARAIASAVAQAGSLPNLWQPGWVAGTKIEPGTLPAKSGEKAPPPASIQLPPPPVTPPDKLLSLGSKTGESRFHLGVDLDPLRGAVRSITLNKFQGADDMGRPAVEADGKTKKLLELVPAAANTASPSFLFYHYDVNAPDNDMKDMPLDTLGRGGWTVVGDKEHPVQVETLAGGRLRQKVSFQAEVQGVVITKTFSLEEGDYHIGLEVRLARKAGTTGGVQFRYELTGAHGLPVEGRWYTGTFRNAMIGRVGERGRVDRAFQDLREISRQGGGNKVAREPDLTLRYLAVDDQYFTSAIVVDDKQEKQAFLDHARPTLETALAKGVLKSMAPDGSSFVLQTADGQEETFYVQPRDQGNFSLLRPGDHFAVLWHSAPYNPKAQIYPQIAAWPPLSEDKTHALWEDDITVRAVTDLADVRPGTDVVHKYLLYNGPVKVSQLYGEEGVSPELVNRYHDTLRLDTLTDYHSPGPMGSFASAIGFSMLVIKCTNIMHAVLGWIHWVIPSYGLCIIVLTMLVRGLMFPISRKQQLMTFKMQQLAPELKKLQEKHKGDRQALAAAQMELYRRHGVNPFGSCWFLLLQMPIFMGLYYALQESIHFRLAPFWPTWIANLAAPDMLIDWGQKIPWISRPQDYGGILYLGPYFNLLPVIAVVLMIFQQKMLTPPPADEQQAMQMKIMRYMMIFIGLMFYKVAAGLCIYFIASSVWGFAERKWLLPKMRPEAGGPVSSEGLFQRMLSRAQAGQAAPAGAGAPARGVTPAPSGDRGRGRQRGRRRPERERVQPAPNEGWLGRLRAWWADVLEQARKK